MSAQKKRKEPFQISVGVLRFFSLGILALVLFNACRLLTPKPTEVGDEWAFTAGAETVVARLTQEAGETAAAQLTQFPVPPLSVNTPTVEIPQFPSPTLEPTATFTLQPTSTPIPPNPTAIPVPCNLAQFVGDVSAPPGVSLPVGAGFVKTWRLRNLGSCTWSTDYALVFARGDLMGGRTVYPFPNAVSPGNVIDLTIDLFAPDYPGTFQGDWFLRDPTAMLFGTGEGRAEPLKVQINVFQPVIIGEGDVNLAVSYCSASWQSGYGQLGCPGVGGDSIGSVVLLEQSNLESGTRRGLTLWTHPNEIRSGWISGSYPAFNIDLDDHFMAEVGCMANSSGCDLNFVLDYRATDGSRGRLGTWREQFDGLTTTIDVDLSSLAGRNVSFILSVTNNGSPANANGFWLEPRIERVQIPSSLVLDWTRKVNAVNACERLRIYLTSAFTAEVRAYSCIAGDVLLDRSVLTLEEFDQLIAWVQRLKRFDGEVYRVTPNYPISYRFTFSGSGSMEAVDAEIQAINSFAVRLYNRVVGSVIIE